MSILIPSIEERPHFPLIHPNPYLKAHHLALLPGCPIVGVFGEPRKVCALRDGVLSSKEPTTMSKTIRDGRTLHTDLNKLPRKTLTSVFEFSEEQASRMMKVRKMLPFHEDIGRTTPDHSARKLWELIGKPYRQFNRWIEYNVKPMMAPETSIQNCAEDFSGQIVKVYKQTKGRHKTDYLLSRDVASDLAMLARTSEGAEVRSYYRDMEECNLKLERYRPIRKDQLTEIDRQLYHAAVSLKGHKLFAEDTRKFITTMVAEVISGMSAREWRESLQKVPGAKGKGIRDVLTGDDIHIYRDAYKFAASLFITGMTDKDDIKSMVHQMHGGSVDPSYYFLPTLDHTEAA